MHPKRNLAVLIVTILLWVAVPLSFGQTESATISGRITDSSGAIVAGVSVKLTSAERGTTQESITNDAGIYVFPNVRPGVYHITVMRQGFQQVNYPSLVANVQDHIEQNFTLKVGSVAESVTVTGSAARLNTEDASVGSVIDSKLVSNLPLNGRTFQTLILMAPGVLLTPTNNTSDPSNGDQGQFSVNGQRANANYVTVDGVSGNFGIGTSVGYSQSTSGSLPATNAQGSFSSLVSADDLQEFRIQTSTFAPEFGRTPGAQISLVTKSGGNQFHGAVFEYFRNDVTDANDWFNDHLGQPKPPLRFNDFGASVGGPIWKTKTFFFFTYEGQRFTLPQATFNGAVPSLDARNNAPNPTAASLLNAFPLPNGPDISIGGVPTGGAVFTKSYSNPSNADSYSIRIDHNVNSRLSFFGRYNQSPSNSFSRSTQDLSQIDELNTNTRTLTLGASWSLTNTLLNDLRVNDSEQKTLSINRFDGFGGGKMLDPSIFIGSASLTDSSLGYYIFGVTDSSGNPVGLILGSQGTATARSINVVDGLSWTKGKHALKFGFDYRWYSPTTPPFFVGSYAYFFSVQDVYNLNAPLGVWSHDGYKLDVVTPNYSAYAQDTWSISPRLTLTYGLRWEINPPPHANGGAQLFTLATPIDLSSSDQSGLKVAPAGTPYYNTKFNMFAPRVGVAYQLNQKPGHETVIRAGGGLFYDLNSTPFATSGWPYAQQAISYTGWPLPVPASVFNFQPPDSTPSPSNLASVDAAGPGYTLPRTYQWNLSVQQGLGSDQTLTLGYVGSAGRKLLRAMDLHMAQFVYPGTFYSPDFNTVHYADNAAISDYNSLQVQFLRQLKKGFQVMANYTWSHSTDDVSTTQSSIAPGYVYDPIVNHGASTFDVRHNFTAAYFYQIPTPKWNSLAEHVLGDWSLSGTWVVRSGLPFNIEMVEVNPALGYSSYARRPNVNPGVPLIVSDPTAPGGWRINNAVDANGNPLAFSAPTGEYAQGDMGRNSIYGFGAWQADMGLHRNFRITERIGAEFRIEAFNIFNHPNFANPSASAQYIGGHWQLYNQYPYVFGESNATMARGFSSGSAGLNPLFQLGGPRDMQAALRITF